MSQMQPSLSPLHFEAIANPDFEEMNEVVVCVYCYTPKLRGMELRT